MRNQKPFKLHEISDIDLHKTKKVYSKFEACMEYLPEILDKLVECREKFKNDWTPARAQTERRILSCMIFDQNGEGWRTGYRIVGADPEKETPEHVYSRNKVSIYLLNRHREKRWTVDELKRQVPILCTTIMADATINSRLSTLSKKHKFTLEQLYKMEHYKMLGLKLEPRRGKTGKILTENIMRSTRTEHIKSLVVNDPELILEQFV